MGYVFISYSSKNQAEADAMRDLFRRNGIDTWMAPYNIPAGSEYAEVLYEALAKCSCLVLLLTNNSQNSAWVKKEVNIAVSNGKTVIPVKLEDVELNSSMKLYLNDQQIVPVHTIDENSEEIKPVLASVFSFVGRNTAEMPVANEKPAAEKMTPRTEGKPSKRVTVNKRTLGIFAGVGALAAALVIFLLIPKGDAPAVSDPDGAGESGAVSTDVSTGHPAESDEAGAESSQSETPPVEMSDELFDFTFQLDGTVYQLPCRFQAFADNGWTISSSGYSSETLLRGNSYETFYVSKDGKKLMLYACNFSGNAKMIADSTVGGVYCVQKDGAEIVLAKDVSFPLSVEQIKDAYGIPSDSYSGTDYERVQYDHASADENSFVRLYCYEDGGYSSIELRHFVSMGDDQTETNTERPAYLSEYIAPTALGENLLDSVLSLEEKLYRLPAPVSVFLENGWEIAEQPGYVVSGGTDRIRVAKDGIRIYLDIANYEVYQTTPENCIVYRVAVSSDDGAELALPCGSERIVLGMSKAELEKLLPDTFDCYEGAVTRTYSYADYKDREFEITFSVSNETGLVSSVRISCSTWDYGS